MPQLDGNLRVENPPETALLPPENGPVSPPEPPSPEAIFSRFTDLIKAGKLESLVPLLFLLQYKGHPVSLEDHFMLAPMFKLKRPLRRILKCARRVGKTFQVSADSDLLAWLIPFYEILIVTPLFSQVERLSMDYLNVFSQHNPFAVNKFPKGTPQRNLLRRYFQGGKIELSYALTSCDRIRSIGANDIRIDEIQDMDDSFIPVIEMVTGAMKGGEGGKVAVSTYSGTPKTLDNTIELYWEQSSAAEPTIRCGCGKENIASSKHDLLNMIGKNTCICAKCGKPLEVEKMYWLHAIPERRGDFEGWHLPQIVHPYHCRNSANWRVLLSRLKTWPTQRIMNEIHGESFDLATMPVTLAELRGACTMQLDNSLKAFEGLRRRARMTVVGIDWEGGGEDRTSTTVISGACLLTGSETIHVGFLERLPGGLNDEEMNRRVLYILKAIKPDRVIYDFANGGGVRETLLTQSGIPLKVMVPFRYDFSPGGNIIRMQHNGAGKGRGCFQMDKTRSIKLACTAVKRQKIVFPGAEYCFHIISDFLNIKEETIESSRGSDYTLIKRKPNKTDDAVNSVNLAASALWYMEGKYPQLAMANQGTYLEEPEDGNSQDSLPE